MAREIKACLFGCGGYQHVEMDGFNMAEDGNEIAETGKDLITWQLEIGCWLLLHFPIVLFLVARICEWLGWENMESTWKV